MKYHVIIIGLMFAFFACRPRHVSLDDFPAGFTPAEVGRILSERFIQSPHASANMINYPEVCTWYGALKFAEVTKDEQLLKKLQARFEPLFNEEKHLLPIISFFKYVKGHYVDFSVFGTVPLELYLQTQDKRYLDLGLFYADYQWTLPDFASEQMREYKEQGLTWQTRYWIDDMYMITILQTKAFLATGNQMYIERAAKEMLAYLTVLQCPNGLFYHAPDAPHYWARGNGWVAVGMTEILRYLSADSPERPKILAAYRKMMETLKYYQKEDGTWGQLIDKADIWTETSGSAMFAYAFITGVKHGWLDAQRFAEVARKAWLSLVPYINEDGDLTEICVGTGKRSEEQFYYERPRRTGDFHGQAPMLWCANALLENVNLTKQKNDENKD